MSLTFEHDNGQNNSIILLAIVKLYASILCCGPASENQKHIKHCFPITLYLGAEKKAMGQISIYWFTFVTKRWNILENYM